MSGRIRTIKPEWRESESLGRCSDAARVLSASLITLADDQGNGRGAIECLAAMTWPYSQVSRESSRESRESYFDPRNGRTKARDSLRELVAIGYVLIYHERDSTYFHLTGWNKHQRVDKPGKPRVPEPSPEAIREALAKVPGSLAPDHGTVGPRSGTRIKDQDLDLDHVAPEARQPFPVDSVSMARKEPTGDHATFIAAFDRLYAEANGGARPTWGAKPGALVARLLKAHGLAECVRRAEVMFRAPPEWPPPPHDLSTLSQHFDRFTGTVAPARPRPGRGLSVEQILAKADAMEAAERERGGA